MGLIAELAKLLTQQDFNSESEPQVSSNPEHVPTPALHEKLAASSSRPFERLLSASSFPALGHNTLGAPAPTPGPTLVDAVGWPRLLPNWA